MSEMVRKPNFICLGAQKAGTTVIYDILKEHSHVFFPWDKEAPFFNNDEAYQKGMEFWMATYCKGLKSEKIIGMFSPEYLYFDFVPERIRTMMDPGMKFLVILRDPATRAYSHYIMSRRRGYETLDFIQAIEMEPERIKENLFSKDNFSYIDRGHYTVQIKRYMEFVPREQILFLSYERDIRKDLVGSLERIENFLGIPIEQLDTSKKSNQASGTYSQGLQRILRGQNGVKKLLRKLLGFKISTKIKQRLNALNESKPIEDAKLSEDLRLEINQKYFSQELNELKELTDIDFGYWLKGKGHDQ